MSICSTLLEMLSNGGRPVEDCIVVAKAMERGEDRDAVYELFDRLLDTDCNDKAMAIAVVALAHQINADNRVQDRRWRGASEPSPYRQRLGLSQTAWRALRQEVFERDGWQCTYCGSVEDPTIDHIVPLIRGGTNDMDNLTPACRSCNSSKGDKLLNEWRPVA